MSLMDEQKRACMKIESSLPPFEELAPILLQEDTLEGYGLVDKSLSTKKLVLD